MFGQLGVQDGNRQKNEAGKWNRSRVVRHTANQGSALCGGVGVVNSIAAEKRRIMNLAHDEHSPGIDPSVPFRRD